MATILIVEDSAVCREPIALTLRAKGYTVICAADGQAGLDALANGCPDLILLDLGMPRIDGLTFLKYLRSSPEGKAVPVIVFTATMDKEAVLKAKALGVREFLLKSYSSLSEIVARVRKYIGEEVGQAKMPPTSDSVSAALARGSQRRPVEPRPNGTARVPSAANPIGTGQALAGNATEISGGIPRLLNRQMIIDSIERCGQAKTLAGVVVQVLALCRSKRSSLGDLAGVLSQDALLATRVLQVANSAAYASGQARITTLEQAVYKIGMTTVRGIAATVGIFQAFPPDASDGFNSVRCWQHCFAVAAIMDRLARYSAGAEPGVAHLVGLCHDLVEITLRQRFAEEYAIAVQCAARTGRPLPEVEAIVFGMPREELAAVLLVRLGLPPVIADPIGQFLRADQTNAPGELSLMAQTLRTAEAYANGLLLAASTDATLRCFDRRECRPVFGDQKPVIDKLLLRAEVMATTHLLARLPPADELILSQPVLRGKPAGIWYCRHPELSGFDPLEAALSVLCRPQIHERLPVTAAECEDCRGIIVAAPDIEHTPCSAAELRATHNAPGLNEVPIVCLTRSPNEVLPAIWPGFQHARFPITLAQLIRIVTGFVENPAHGGELKAA